MISVIISMFNGKGFIEKTVDSILAQTVSKEIIIIDDCSTDGSYEFVLKLYKDNPCITVLKNITNNGFCKTVNHGIDIATKDFILVIGQDDILQPNHCEKMMDRFLDDVCMVFCDYDLINDNDEVFDTANHCNHRDITIKDLYKFNAIPSVGLIMRKNILEKVGGYPELKDFPNYGEYHLWIRMALNGKVVFCKDVRAKYRRHKTNITNTFIGAKAEKRLNKYYNICRREIINSEKVNILIKIFTLMFMLYYTLKVNLKYYLNFE